MSSPKYCLLLQPNMNCMKSAGFFSRLLAFFVSALLSLQINAIGQDNVPSPNDKSLPSITASDCDSLVVMTDFITINFRLDDATIDSSYMGNDGVIVILKDLIERVGVENIISINSFSQSSPEGSFSHNDYLTKERAESTAAFFNEHFPSLAGLVKIQTIPEAWDEIRTRVVSDQYISNSGRKKVLQIIDSDLDLDKKKQLMRDSLGTDERVGSLYWHIYNRYYKRARRSGISISYCSPSDVKPVAEIPVTEPVVETTQPEPAAETPVPEPVAEQEEEQQVKVDTVEAFAEKTALPLCVDSEFIAKDFVDINFRFDKSDIDLTFMNNNSVVSTLSDLIDYIGVENITSIDAVSQSSPEGKFGYNVNLAERRAESTARFFNEYFPELSGLVKTKAVGEAWAEIRDYVEADTVISPAGRSKVLQIIDSDADVDEKERLMKESLGNDGRLGSLYWYIYNNYYKKVRFSGISISYVSVCQEEEQPTEVVDTIVPEPVDTIVPAELTPTVVVDQETVPFREPMLSVKTNLLYDAFFYPGMGYEPILNVEAEYYPKFSDRWTILAEMEFPWWSDDSEYEYFQMLNWQLEGRRYFVDDNKHLGHYLSAYAQYNLFDFCMGNSTGSGVQGEGTGIGLGYGYVMPLDWGKENRWKLEFFVKAGYYESHYDPYDAGVPYEGKYYYRWYEEPESFIRRNWRFRWFGPTGVGVTLSYDILDRHK